MVVKITISNEQFTRYQVQGLYEALYTRSFSVVFRQPDRAQDIFASLFAPSLWAAAAATMVLLAAGMVLMSGGTGEYSSLREI